MTGIVAFLAWAAAAGIVSLLAGLVIGAMARNRDRHG